VVVDVYIYRRTVLEKTKAKALACSAKKERNFVDIKFILICAGSLIALLLYYPLVKGILKGTVEQSFATWILWVALDVILLVATVIQHGNFALVACYCFGGTLVTSTLIYKRQFNWSWFESSILAMVVVCLIVWYLNGPKATTVASTIAVAISGLPQLRNAWLRPDRQMAMIYFGYVLANGLSCMGGKAWTVEDRLYYGVCTILCAIITIVAFRKPTAASVSAITTS